MRSITGWEESMKQLKQYTYMIVNGIYLAITTGFDLYAYAKLPDTMKTQISITGGSANTMPKSIYMAVTVGLLLILTALGSRREKAVQIKYTIINAIIVIANIVIIAVQL